MSKAVMLSISPKWCEKIVSGEKTIEVRKTKPKLKTPFKCYVYCTSGYLPYKSPIGMGYRWCESRTVIGEFTCDRIYELAPINHAPDDIEKQACLTREEIVNYLNGTGYGWHISALLVYDQSRELTEFRRACPNSWYCESCAMYRENNGTCGNESLYIKRPPQSWCYVEEG